MAGAWQGSDRVRRLPPGWKRIRVRVLARHPICVLCGVRPSGRADHIEAKTDDHTRLQGVCKECHDQKSSREGHEAKRNNPRPGRRRPPEQHPGLR